MNDTINIEAGDMGLVVAFVLLVGKIVKDFTPIKNELIPLITWALGGLLYQWLAGGWADPRQWMMALISVAGATGLHSATRSTTALVKNPGGPDDGNMAGRVGLFLVLGLLSVGLMGCRSLAPTGVYKGDKVLFQAETTIVTSYELVDTFLKWERANEDLLALKWPEIHKAADRLRGDFPKWYATANALRDAYQVNPDPATRDKLTTALALLRTALTEAAGYMAQTTQPN